MKPAITQASLAAFAETRDEIETQLMAVGQRYAAEAGNSLPYEAYLNSWEVYDSSITLVFHDLFLDIRRVVIPMSEFPA